MQDYEVRPVRETDIEAIIAIDKLIREDDGADRSGFWRGLLSYQTMSLDQEGDPAESAPEPRPQPLCEVAVKGSGSDGRVAGFIIGDVQSWQFGLPRHGRIVTIGIHPEHRRRGVGALLANSLFGTFRKMGLPFVHCLVRPGDPLGDFFGALGFVRPEFEIREKRL